MNAITINSGVLHMATQPPDAWSRRQTLFSALMCAVLVFVPGMQTWRIDVERSGGEPRRAGCCRSESA